MGQRSEQSGPRAASGSRFASPFFRHARIDPVQAHYSGEMDRYAERLDSAASDADKAKIRPNDDEDEQDDE